MNEENALFEEELQQDEMIPTEESQEAQPQEQPAQEEALFPEVMPEDAPQTELIPVEQEEEPQQELVPVAPEEMPETEAAEEASGEEPSEEVPSDEAAAEAPASTPAELPYHERYYLKYRQGKRTAEMDLDGTKAFLQTIGFDGGELRQARMGKDKAEALRSADGKNAQMRCSYCGAEIAGVEFFRLPDGRLRCTTCSNSVVKTKAEVEEICQRVINNLDNFFGASIDVPIAIEVLDERKLKKKIKAPLGTRDDQSMLILGVAINQKKKYSMLLENGAPRISLIATFAHELTHIWQYTHWDNRKDFKKCPKNKRLLIYEGMAKWAEIQYLYLIGEATVAKREEMITRQRQDEYGIGFCLYEDRFPLSRDAMTCDETPFTPDSYPFD